MSEIIDTLADRIEAINQRTIIKVIDIVLALPDSRLRDGLKEWKRGIYAKLIEASEHEDTP